MYLDTTAKTLELVLGAAKTTNDCEFTADYIDTQSGTTFGPANAIGVSNGTTAVTAVPAPAASIQRKISAFTFYNADTVNTAVTMRIFDGTNRRRVISLTLSPGQSLIYTPEAGWTVLQSTAGQIQGTTTNDSAAAGNVGEYIESVVLNASAIAISNGVTANLTSIILSAGDWDVEAAISFNPSVSLSVIVGAVNNVSATMPDAAFQSNFAGTIPGRAAGIVPRRRFSVAGATTVYAVGQASFSSGTCLIYGYLNARRVR